jgi:hypothetical protein
MSSYEKYVKDENFLAFYNDYQKRCAGEIAERDKVVLGLIADKSRGMAHCSTSAARPVTCCSTSNGLSPR